MRNKSIPAVPYMNLVRQFAQARGIKCFTMTQMVVACQLYEHHATILN